jgi:hypothetical protein
MEKFWQTSSVLDATHGTLRYFHAQENITNVTKFRAQHTPFHFQKAYELGMTNIKYLQELETGF